MKTITDSATNLTQGIWGKPSGKRDARLQEQCKQFEAVLTGEMLKAMRKTVSDAKGWFAQSSGERTSREMYDERLTSVLAQRGSLSVGRAIYDRVKVSLNADSLPTQAGGGQFEPISGKKAPVASSFTSQA